MKQLKPEKEMEKILHSMQADIKHVRSDVDMLKAVILEDALLTKEERASLDKMMEDIRSGRTENFTPLDKV